MGKKPVWLTDSLIKNIVHEIKRLIIVVTIFTGFYFMDDRQKPGEILEIGEWYKTANVRSDLIFIGQFLALTYPVLGYLYSMYKNSRKK